MGKPAIFLLERHKYDLWFAPYDGRTREGRAQKVLLQMGLLRRIEQGLLRISRAGLLVLEAGGGDG